MDHLCCWNLRTINEDGVGAVVEWINTQAPVEVHWLVGGDPKDFFVEEWDHFSNLLTENYHSLVGLETNLVDIVWDTRPPCPNSPLRVLDPLYTGPLNWAEKAETTSEEFFKIGYEIQVLENLEEVAWLLGLRAQDVRVHKFD